LHHCDVTTNAEPSGTVAGIIASIAFSLAAVPLGLLGNEKAVLASVVAAFIATTAESYIGAIFQDSVPWLSNELVNVINTVIGALVAMLLMLLLQ
jgi:uncharacterized membrane protein